MESVVIQVNGLVQGVGFRPWVWRLADSLLLKGWVRNSTDGVTIHAEGDCPAIEKMKIALTGNPPPLSKITRIQIHPADSYNCTTFEIKESSAEGDSDTLVSPDIAICDNCADELFDPADRRYQYPFINCTDCGPRFSIIRQLPYDRPNTSMAPFQMCADCKGEYENPSDRRYHAQPVACPVCGPRVWATDKRGNEIDEDWLAVWRRAVMSGQIVAVKGLGGFHLACLAVNPETAAQLRFRKRREAKPFAVMCGNTDWLRRYCHLSRFEKALLKTKEAPITLLKVKEKFDSLQHIAPGLDSLGVMLPYSPMHLLMMSVLESPVIMTSANYSSEPMLHKNEEALDKLGGLADLFILHNREIVNRCDDSVCRGSEGFPAVIRPGRGMAPFSVNGTTGLSLLAMGADMKNTFAVSHHGRIHVSPFIGDLVHPETQYILEKSIQQHLYCYQVTPEAVVCDSHPDYFSTRLGETMARNWNVPLVRVQHHFAHLAAARIEHNIEGDALGFAFDGTGYGDDGTVWGGEILLFNEASWRRVMHLKPVPMPGGEAAVKQPGRMLWSWLKSSGLLERADSLLTFQEADMLESMVRAELNCPMTSSMGRLFDAVSYLLGLCRCQTFDGEAAMRLEAAAGGFSPGLFPFTIEGSQIDMGPLFEALLEGVETEKSTGYIAASFHNTIAEIIYRCGTDITIDKVSIPWVFSGGVFQNALLVSMIKSRCEQKDRHIYFSSYANDSGIALGQAAAAAAILKKGQ